MLKRDRASREVADIEIDVRFSILSISLQRHSFEKLYFY